MATFISEFLPVLTQCITNRNIGVTNQADWREWRDCYAGGSHFRSEYLEQYDGKEETADYNRRERLTPIPTYAKKEINAVKNAVSQRLPDIIRREGSDKWQEAVRGVGRGIDLRGSSMNNYISQTLLAEMLIMGEVGVLVEAPELPKMERQLSKADIPKTFQPYLNMFAIEDAPILIEAPSDSVSDWAHVLLRSHKHEFNLKTGKNDCVESFRYYWLDEARGGLVSIVSLDANGVENAPQIHTDLEAIPFVNFDIGGSLIADVCSHQITLLNMISADSSYAIDSNYSFLTRQRGNNNAGSHLTGGEGDDTVRTGSKRGLFYNKGMDRPGFIAPPTAPMKASLELRRELKAEVRELVRGAVADLGDEGSIESGLASIGFVTQAAEQRCWDHYVAYEEKRPDQRKAITPSVQYPESWSMKTDEERIEVATKLLTLGMNVIGREAKEQAAVDAIDFLHRGKKTTEQIDAMKKAVKNSPIVIGDPQILISAKKEGILCVETAAVGLGAEEGEGERALADAAKRAEMVVAAQSDVNEATRGNEDGQAGEDSERLSREGEAKGESDLKEKASAGRPEVSSE